MNGSATKSPCLKLRNNMLTSILGILGAALSAAGAYFVYRTKTAQTPEQSEIQKARDELAAQKQQNADFVNKNK